MSAGGAVALTGAAVVVAALVAVLAALLERAGPIRLRSWAHEAGGRLAAVYAAPQRFEAFRFLLSWMARVLAPIALLALVAALTPWLGARAWILALALVVVLVGAVELTNRALVGGDPETALERLTPAYRAAVLVLQPLVVAAAPAFPHATAEEDDEDDEDATEEEIEAFIRVGADEGILEPQQESLVWGIVEFADKPVRSVMTPRIDMVCAPVAADLQTLTQVFLESKHSRLPLYRDSIDQVVGTLHIRDLLAGLGAEEEVTAEQLAKPAYFVPETKRLDRLLREFQSRHVQFAIVVDEYGGTAGVVTIEDLLEEIVGDMPDEDETEPPVNEVLADGRWRFDGRARLEDLEDVFGVEVGESDYETVGGLIFGKLGYIPRGGESIEAFGLRLTAERVSERRVVSVIVEPQARAPAEEAADV